MAIGVEWQKKLAAELLDYQRRARANGEQFLARVQGFPVQPHGDCSGEEPKDPELIYYGPKQMPTGFYVRTKCAGCDTTFVRRPEWKEWNAQMSEDAYNPKNLT